MVVCLMFFNLKKRDLPMNDKKTLVIDIDRKFLTKSIFFASFMIGLLACLFYLDKSIIYYLFGYYVHFIIQGFIATFMFGIIAGVLFSCWVLLDKNPVAIKILSPLLMKKESGLMIMVL